MAYTEKKKQEVLRLLATEAGNNTTRCAQLTGISKTTILHWKKTQEIAPPFPPHTPASPKQNNPDKQTVPGASSLQTSPNSMENTQETSHPTLPAQPQTSYSQANSTITTINTFPTPSTHSTPVPPPVTSLRSASLPAEKSSRPLPINHPLSSGNLPTLTPSATTPEISETPEEAPPSHSFRTQTPHHPPRQPAHRYLHRPQKTHGHPRSPLQIRTRLRSSHPGNPLRPPLPPTLHKKIKLPL